MPKWTKCRWQSWVCHRKCPQCQCWDRRHSKKWSPKSTCRHAGWSISMGTVVPCKFVSSSGTAVCHSMTAGCRRNSSTRKRDVVSTSSGRCPSSFSLMAFNWRKHRPSWDLSPTPTKVWRESACGQDMKTLKMLSKLTTSWSSPRIGWARRKFSQTEKRQRNCSPS